jgi:hypothetical protein
MFDVEKSIAEAYGKFKELADFVLMEGQCQDAYVVEHRLFHDGLKALGCLLEAYFRQRAAADTRKAVETDADGRLPRERVVSRRYVSVFGELELPRPYYHRDGLSGLFPLDEETNLPERLYSYFVQELVQRRVNRKAYDEVIAEMEQLFGLKLDKHTIERLAVEIARDADASVEAEPAPAPESEGAILAAFIDGKGVPMVKEKPAERKTRLGPGEKYSRKKEAMVAVVHSIAPHPRTVEDIVTELCEHRSPPERPKAQNKRVRVTFEGKQDAMDWVAREVARRDPQNRKRRVCVMDGSLPLWRAARATLKGFTFVLDLFHALEYMWEAAYVFHPVGSAEAEAFVRHRLRMLLEGKVGRVIGGLRQMLTKHEDQLSKSRRKTLHKVIGYYEGHRQWMHYDRYIAAGLPIGSGAVEGACAHVVKDRMEGSGMRWKLDGAEAVLKSRALDLNGQWESFWRYHMAQEAERRFGSRNRLLDPLRSAALSA